MTPRLAVLALGVALLTGCSGFLTGCSAFGSTTAAPSRSYQVAVIGDSFTGGSAEGGVGPRGWPALVRTDLAKKGLDLAIRLAPEGGAGYAVRGISGGVFGDQVKTVVGAATDLVVFFGSTNDVTASADQLTTAVSNALAKAREYAPAAHLLIIGPTWGTAVPPPELVRVRDVLRDQATAANATFVDPLAEHWIADTPGLLGSDGTHPTDEGHRYLAERIGPAISSSLA